MENLTFTISMRDIYFFIILLASMWGIVKIYKEIRQPSADLKARVKEHDNWLHKDLKRLDRIDDGLDLLLECLYGLIDHQITGNGVESFKKLKEEINKYLLKRGRDISDN